MIISPLTRSKLLKAFEERNNTVVADMGMFLQSLDVYAQPRCGVAVSDDGLIYAAFGIVPLWHGVGEAWMVPTVHSKARKVALGRALRIGFDDLCNELKMHRVQAAAKVGHNAAHRLLEFVGMKSEGVMHRYGPDGSDFVRYAK
jgi:hypothetical protein